MNKHIELDDVQPELANRIREIMVRWHKGISDDELIANQLEAWTLIPEPKTQYYTPAGDIALELAYLYIKSQEYQKSLEWILLAIEARKDIPDVTVMIYAGIVYYELSDMENAYKYFDITYDMDRYSPFASEDKKYWQFYKAEKEIKKSKKNND